MPSSCFIACAESKPPAKSALSKNVLSGERLKEPVPFQGRKELISLVEKAMHSPNQEAASPPTSKRKRNIASPRHSNMVYPTPMSLHFPGFAFAGAGIVFIFQIKYLDVKDKLQSYSGTCFSFIGKPRTKEEGPCVGTKGFRAPEVSCESAVIFLY